MITAGSPLTTVVFEVSSHLEKVIGIHTWGIGGSTKGMSGFGFKFNPALSTIGLYHDLH
jgi:hypothetical protein